MSSDTIGPITTDQDIVNAILALSAAMNVERWRETMVLPDGTEPPLNEVVADSISDLQRCARHIREWQARGSP